jgi:hypothetical protein
MLHRKSASRQTLSPPLDIFEMDDPMEGEVVHSKTSGRENVTRPPSSTHRATPPQETGSPEQCTE